MARRTKVMFLCTGNACRSQIGEGWLRHLAGDRFEACSAGTDPHGLNPRAVATMAEVGVDISHHTSDPVGDYLSAPPDLVIAVCDAAAQSCPIFPGRVSMLRWPFPDPGAAVGSEEEIAAVFAEVRDAIRARVETWLAEQPAG